MVEAVEGTKRMHSLAFFRVERAAQGFTFSQWLGPRRGTFLEFDLVDEVETALAAGVSPVGILTALHHGVVTA